VWNQLRPADIERAKRRLAARRTKMLRRHEEELNRLDIDQHEVEIFARLVAAFANKHLVPFAPEPTTSEDHPAQPLRAANLEFPTHDGSTSSLRGSKSEISERPFENLAGDTFSIAGLIALLNPGG
jgi:hypothetical protein